MRCRKRNEKGMRLRTAVIWTVWTGLETVLILKEFCSPYRDGGRLFLYICTLILVLIGCICFWHRYLTCDKTTNKSDDKLGGNDHER